MRTDGKTALLRSQSRAHARVKAQDWNDTLREGGTDAVRARWDRAPFIKFNDKSSNGEIGKGEYLDTICMADVRPRPVDWLWENWIAVGKVSVLAGDGGQGKSTILCDLAARDTTGQRWPDGAPGDAPASVIILAAEDDAEDTLAPRLIAAGADMRRIFNVRAVRGGERDRRTFSLQADLAKLESEIRARENVRLVIIDPVTSYLGKVDSHKNAEVRTVLEPLGEMAARLRVAIVCNNHFSKAVATRIVELSVAWHSSTRRAPRSSSRPMPKMKTDIY